MLDAKGGIPTSKSRSINKLIVLSETLDLMYGVIYGNQETLKSVNTLFDKNIYLELFNKDYITFSSQNISKNMLKKLTI